MICFDVSALTQARLGAAFTLDVDAEPQCLTDGLDEQSLEVDFLRGTVQFTRVQGGVLVQGALGSQLKLECGRCLEFFTLPITLELEETFRLAGTSPKPDMPYSVSDSGWVDLIPLLREQGWLSIPMKPLCTPDCNGLCVQCGANLSLESCACESTRGDPRLAVLEELLELS
ncbi:MAG: DUF177 domain-containing protein [Chloroflexi bacterium]|nr:DUF177 domain-containing protein [Chloroflexota bacterium]